MRRYFVEAFGAFFLTFAVSFTSFTGNPIPIGLMLMALIYIGMHISGAHYNPAFSLASFLQHKMDMHTMLWYMGSQVVGALAALLLFTYVTDIVFAPELPLDVPLYISMGMEILLAFVLILTLLTALEVEQHKNSAREFILGLTLIAVSSIGGINFSFNPAIALAAYVINIIKDGMFVGLNPCMIYIAGPLIAAVAAHYTYNFIRR